MQDICQLFLIHFDHEHLLSILYTYGKRKPLTTKGKEETEEGKGCEIKKARRSGLFASSRRKPTRYRRTTSPATCRQRGG